MKRLLLTGMCGTGKSSVIARLRELGHPAIDMDEVGWSSWDEAGHQHWNDDRLREAMKDEQVDLLFVAGCAESQVAFYPAFDAIVLLSAPEAVITHRLATRENNPYGKRPEELAAVLANLREIEPLLRKGATHEIVTTVPLDEVMDRVLAIAGVTRGAIGG